MKKIVTLVLSLALVMALLVSATACNKEYDLEFSWEIPNYKELGTVASDMDSLELYLSALENYNNAEYFRYTKGFTFEAALGLATQQTQDIIKFNGDEVFFQVTKQGSGLGKSNLGERFYSNGTEGYIVSEDSEQRFPELGTEDWSGMTYTSFDDENVTLSDKVEEYRMFTGYTVNADLLADNHDSNVYEYNDKYYICLTIDCMGIEVGGVQKFVEDDIMVGLGDSAKAGSFQWREDTLIYLEITDIDGKYMITARNSEEYYSAIQSGLRVNAEQITSGKISYEQDDALISEDEKLNLA